MIIAYYFLVCKHIIFQHVAGNTYVVTSVAILTLQTIKVSIPRSLVLFDMIKHHARIEALFGNVLFTSALQSISMSTLEKSLILTPLIQRVSQRENSVGEGM